MPGQTDPINPHAQRLLVAATKDAKSIKGKGKGKKEEPKGGPKSKSQVAKDGAPRKNPAEGDRSKTAYALAKDLFVDGFLDCIFVASMNDKTSLNSQWHSLICLAVLDSKFRTLTIQNIAL